MNGDMAARANVVAENERQYRVIDQLLSMHSVLRDTYRRRAFLLNTLQIGVSLLLCVLAFVGDELLESAGYDAQKTRLYFGLGAVVVLLTAIAEYRVDWKGVSARHHDATNQLAGLKAQYRETRVDRLDEPWEAAADLRTAYDRMMAVLPPIPERAFNRLKAHHEFKRVLSRRLSDHPTAFTWLLRIQLRFEGAIAALRRKESSSL